MDNRKFVTQIVCIVFIVSVVTLSACAQNSSAQDIINTMLEKYEQRMEGIENYTMVSQINEGQTYTIYFERQMVNGHPVYRVAENSVTDEFPDKSAIMKNRYTFVRKLKSQARLTGTERINGHAAFKLTANNLSNLSLDTGEHMSPQAITFWVDTDEYVTRKIRVQGIVKTRGSKHNYTIKIEPSQYKEVEGMVIPFKTTIAMKGMLTSKQGKRMKKAVQKMKKNLEKLPPKQRKRVKRMMNNIGGMKGLSQGNINMTMKVKEVRVNTGPPKS